MSRLVDSGGMLWGSIVYFKGFNVTLRRMSECADVFQNNTRLSNIYGSMPYINTAFIRVIIDCKHLINDMSNNDLARVSGLAKHLPLSDAVITCWAVYNRYEVLFISPWTLFENNGDKWHRYKAKTTLDFWNIVADDNKKNPSWISMIDNIFVKIILLYFFRYESVSRIIMRQA